MTAVTASSPRSRSHSARRKCSCAASTATKARAVRRPASPGALTSPAATSRWRSGRDAGGALAAELDQLGELERALRRHRRRRSRPSRRRSRPRSTSGLGNRPGCHTCAPRASVAGGGVELGIVAQRHDEGSRRLRWAAAVAAPAMIRASVRVGRCSDMDRLSSGTRAPASSHGRARRTRRDRQAPRSGGWRSGERRLRAAGRRCAAARWRAGSPRRRARRRRPAPTRCAVRSSGSPAPGDDGRSSCAPDRRRRREPGCRDSCATYRPRAPGHSRSRGTLLAPGTDGSSSTHPSFEMQITNAFAGARQPKSCNARAVMKCEPVHQPSLAEAHHRGHREHSDPLCPCQGEKTAH